MNLFSVAFSLFVTVLFILYYTVFRKNNGFACFYSAWHFMLIQALRI